MLRKSQCKECVILYIVTVVTILTTVIYSFQKKIKTQKCRSLKWFISILSRELKHTENLSNFKENVPENCNFTINETCTLKGQDNNPDFDSGYTGCLALNENNGRRDIIVGSILAFMSIIGTLSNLFICLVAKKYRFYKTTRELLIVILAISDFLICITIIPLNGLYFLCGNSGFMNLVGETVCKNAFLVEDYYIVFLCILPIASFALMLMSIERFLTLRYPFRQSMLTRHRVLWCYVLIWVYSGGNFTIFWFIGQKHFFWFDIGNLGISNILPLLVNSLVYIYIQRQVYRHSKSY